MLLICSAVTVGFIAGCSVGYEGANALDLQGAQRVVFIAGNAALWASAVLIVAAP